ncbi:hypothetical protein [Rhodococcoides corynebacterioides]|uniref:hypothetical protein n=1 Tax=Rhodococcoides corynebacterioides TaxID=53972 RepID=UPI003AEF06B4
MRCAATTIAEGKFVPDRVLDTAFAAALRRAGTSSRSTATGRPSAVTTGSGDAAAVGG